MSRIPTADNLPLFPETPGPVLPPLPTDALVYKQVPLPDMPSLQFETVPPEAVTLWQYKPPEEPEPEIPPPEDERQAQLLTALAAYNLAPAELHRLATMGHDLTTSLKTGQATPEMLSLLSVLSTLFRPHPREQIRSPSHAAAFLMVEMGTLDQEELRTLLLDTKNRIHGTATVYKGSLNSAIIRVGEVFKEALRYNSASIIVAHNHPSGDPTPSPEDVLVTQKIVEAGKLLDVDVLDHLVISQGKFVSMRERGLGFSAF